MDIMTEIKKLNFPATDYVVIAGAALAARGMRETRDIDIVASEELLEKCRQNKEWKHHPRIILTGKPGLTNEKHTIELYPDVGGVDIPFEELRKNAEIIEGIPFASLEDVIRIKKAYKREKDLKDIEMIENFLKRV